LENQDKLFTFAKENGLIIRTIMETLVFEQEKKVVKSSPCQFTVEELRAEVAKSLKDYEKGNYVTIEKMRAKHPRL
jgi:hypothetical protein